MTKVGFPNAPIVSSEVYPSYWRQERKMTKSVPQALNDLGDLYRERNKMYGDNYKEFGKVMMGLFPKGLSLQTEDDFNRFGCFLQIVSKVSRYAPSLNGVGGGHADSLDDICVYSAMLRELDGIIADEDLKKTF